MPRPVQSCAFSVRLRMRTYLGTARTFTHLSNEWVHSFVSLVKNVLLYVIWSVHLQSVDTCSNFDVKCSKRIIWYQCGLSAFTEKTIKIEFHCHFKINFELISQDLYLIYTFKCFSAFIVTNNKRQFRKA